MVRYYKGGCLAFVTIAERWKDPKYPWVDGRISKTWSLHRMAYYAALKRKETLTPATTWVDVTVSEISQSRKNKHGSISVRGGQIQTQEVGWWVPGAGGRGGQLGFHGDGISVGDDEKLLETLVVMVAQGYERPTHYRAVYLRVWLRW